MVAECCTPFITDTIVLYSSHLSSSSEMWTPRSTSLRHSWHLTTCVKKTFYFLKCHQKILYSGLKTSRPKRRFKDGGGAGISQRYTENHYGDSNQRGLRGVWLGQRGGLERQLTEESALTLDDSTDSSPRGLYRTSRPRRPRALWNKNMAIVALKGEKRSHVCENVKEIPKL